MNDKPLCYNAVHVNNGTNYILQNYLSLDIFTKAEHYHLHECRIYCSTVVLLHYFFARCTRLSSSSRTFIVWYSKSSQWIGIYLLQIRTEGSRG